LRQNVWNYKIQSFASLNFNTENKKMIKALLFDFNGVIIDDEPVQMRAYQEVLREEGIDLTEEGYLACLGMNDEVFLKTIYQRAEKELDPQKIPQLVEAKTEKWKVEVDKQLPLFDGIEDFIKRMENDFTLGLVSMARRPEIDHILEKTGLGKYFSAIVSAEDVSTIKPDPECYREGFRRVDLARTSKGLSPITRRECVVIEDSPPGIISGKKVRLKTLGVTSTVSAEELRKAGADAVTDSLKDWFPDSFKQVFS
jgi:HAD superfamily hydrolase (TIGR01509 family)